MDDLALVARARTGDLAATQTLLERHQGTAYTAALRVLGEPSDAEDVTQDALVRAYTRLPDLADGASFSAWLRKIAINLSLNVLRRRGALRFEPLDAPSETSGARADTPEGSALEVELHEALDALVRRLPSEQRVAVVLRDVYGYDVAEVADLQRCGISAAKMRIARGRAQLRRWIVEAGLREAESAR